MYCIKVILSTFDPLVTKTHLPGVDSVKHGCFGVNKSKKGKLYVNIVKLYFTMQWFGGSAMQGYRGTGFTNYFIV